MLAHAFGLSVDATIVLAFWMLRRGKLAVFDQVNPNMVSRSLHRPGTYLNWLSRRYLEIQMSEFPLPRRPLSLQATRGTRCGHHATQLAQHSATVAYHECTCFADDVVDASDGS